MNTNAYMATYMNPRYHQRRRAMIDALGGRCVQCGATDALEIDHIDRTTKSFDIGKHWSGSPERLATELAKCQLLCARHHRAKSGAERSVAHGGGVSGKRNCGCDPCRARKREYMRNYTKAAS